MTTNLHVEQQPQGALPELATWIDRQPVLLGDGWLRSLDDRKQEEADFHDADRTGHKDEQADSTPNRRFYEAGAIMSEFIGRWLERAAARRTFLDYACGNGAMVIKAAKAGATLAVGIDISAISVQNGQENAMRAGVTTTTRFLQRDCEATGFPDQSFDAILCSGMLHHLDLTKAFPELHRILKPGGRILCGEALSYNPFIQLYRNRTPELRTAWEKEHILGLKEVRMAQQWFDVENLKCHLMSAPLATFLPKGPIRRAGIVLGHALDRILTRIPLLRWWAWQFTFELVRR